MCINRVRKNALFQGVCKCIVLCLLSAGMLIISSCGDDNSAMTSEKDIVKNRESNSYNAKVEISMEEAIAIGLKEATQYYDDLQLTSVYSYDNDYVRKIDAGKDGKREWWYVSFGNEQNNYVNVLVMDGEIVSVFQADDNANSGLINTEDIKMTAEEAVARAVEIGLIGGNPDDESQWVSGYNFNLSYGSLVSEPDIYRVFLEVIGISPNGNFAHIDFDATTGECILVEEKWEYENGNVAWTAWE